MTTVAVVLTPNVHILDVAGPAQVFIAANDYLDDGVAPYQIHYFGEHPAITSHQGLPLTPKLEWPALHRSDLVLVPGWRGATARVPLSPAMLTLIAEHHRDGGAVASVCSGAFALGAAGLLEGRRSSTHHSLERLLVGAYPQTRVISDVLFTGDDGVFTSAGVASGIDLALELVSLRHGPALAARVARTLVVYGRRGGGAPQRNRMVAGRNHPDDIVHRTLEHLDANFTRPVPLSELSGRVGVTDRTLTRIFRSRMNTTPLRYQQRLRLERANELIEQGATAEYAAHTVGFTDARMLRRLRSAPKSRPETPGSPN